MMNRIDDGRYMYSAIRLSSRRADDDMFDSP